MSIIIGKESAGTIYARSHIEAALRKKLSGLTLRHFGGTDDLLCLALADELRLRNVDLEHDTVLLFSE
jgi:hypothetical protein